MTVDLRARLLRMLPPAPPASASGHGYERGHEAPDGDDAVVGPDGATYLVRQQTLSLSQRHGAFALEEVAAVSAEALALLGDAAPREGIRGPPLFFDTETTSLGSGAGVYVFLIGFAWVDAARRVLALEQLYLRDVAGERAMLLAAAERIRAAPFLVSYAGRGFDERRLEDRYRFLGLESPFAPRAHADLCPIARALWRTRLPSCALSTLERERLGVFRDRDVPGAECPATYFRALRGDAAAREGVLRHNRDDLLSLAALAAALERKRAGERDPSEHLGFGRHERRRGRLEAALAALEAAARAEALLRPEERRELRLELAAALRRAGREEEAAAHLRALCLDRRGGGDPPFEALLDLARWAEHRARDLALAERCAIEALSLLRRRATGHVSEKRAVLESELARRLARIERKARSGLTASLAFGDPLGRETLPA